MTVKTIDFMGKRKLWFQISGLAIAVSIIALLTIGLNLGIDFTGGTLLERGFPEAVTGGQIRQALEAADLDIDLDKSVIQPTADGRQALIRMVPLDNAQIGQVDAALQAQFGEVETLRTAMVGPVIGSELIRQALSALILASLLIVAYVAVRFHRIHGIVAGSAAIFAVVHDVLITLGILSLLGREINSPFVAAILTVVGYSINDTIVVFDRIRENVQFGRKESIAEVANRSIVETLPRSINTSLTTLFVVGSLLIFGGSSIHDFITTLFIGVLVGTYSSIFIASPIWVAWRRWESRRSAAAR